MKKLGNTLFSRAYLSTPNTMTVHLLQYSEVSWTEFFTDKINDFLFINCYLEKFLNHVFKIAHVWHDSLTFPRYEWSCVMIKEFFPIFLIKLCALYSKSVNQITKVVLVGPKSYESRKVLEGIRVLSTTQNRHTPHLFQWSKRMFYNRK